MTRHIHNILVRGVEVDEQTRCKHYHTKLDIIAFKFSCCNTYYPCILCHYSLTDHDAITWSFEQLNTKAVLCGACGYELTINEYRTCSYQCPSCSASFNPACAKHEHYYFDATNKD